MPQQVLYKDVFSGDVLLSNYYKIEPIFHGAIYKVKSHFMIRDPSSFNASTPESNPHQHEASELTKKIIRYSIVEKFGYHERNFKKKEFMMIINAYIQALKSLVEEKEDATRERDFLMGSTLFTQTILSNYNHYKFFIGPSNDINHGMIIIQDCTTDLLSPEFYFFVDGLEEEIYETDASKHVDQVTNVAGSPHYSIPSNKSTEDMSETAAGSVSSTGSPCE